MSHDKIKPLLAKAIEAHGGGVWLPRNSIVNGQRWRRSASLTSP
jgi:hypothetical protein